MLQDSFFFFLIYAVFFALVLSFLIIIIKLILGMLKAVFKIIFPAKAKIASKKNEEKIENINESKQQIANNSLNRPLNAGSEEKKETEKKPASAESFGEAKEKNKGAESQQKITVQQKISPIGSVSKEAGKDASGKYFIKDIDESQKTGIDTKFGIIHPTDVLEKGKIFKHDSLEEIPLYEKPAPLKDDLTNHQKQESMGQNNPTDTSIFNGKTELSRSELRQRLSDDPKVWSAQKQAGLNLTSSEREKLEKEVFSQSYGGNISKTDFKSGVRKLSQKMMSEKNIVEKAKIRKEINFLKKIGGK